MRAKKASGGYKESDFERESGDIAERLALGLAKLGTVIRHGNRRDALLHGLSPTQADIIVSLSRHKGLTTLASIAKELGVGLPTASEAVAALVAKRLVKKGRSTKDKRALCLELTPKGRQMAVRLAGWPDHLITALSSLSEDEQVSLLQIVIALVSRLQQEGAISVARMCTSCVFFRPYLHDDPERPHHCELVGAALGDRSIRIDCPDHLPRKKLA